MKLRQRANPRDAHPNRLRGSERRGAVTPSGLDFCGTLYVDMPSRSYPAFLRYFLSAVGEYVALAIRKHRGTESD